MFLTNVVKSGLNKGFKTRGKVDNTIPFYERYFLVFELITILIFLFLTFAELFYALKFITKLSSIQNYYFYYLIIERIQFKEYIADIYHVDAGKECESEYEKTKWLKLDYLVNIELEDETDYTYYYDTQNKLDDGPKFVNSTLLNRKYYKFDYNKKGNFTTALQNDYEFVNLYNYSLCELPFVIDNSEPFHLISSEISCNDYFKSEYYIDCGQFYNAYTFCVDLSMIKYKIGVNKNKRVIDTDYKSKNDLSFFCPLNQVYFNKEDLDKGYLIYMNRNKLENTKKMQLDYSKYLEDIDKSFLFKFDLPSFELNVNYESQKYDTNKPYYNHSIYEFHPESNNGFIDSFSKILVTESFADIYNYTFYIGSVVVNNSYTSYIPTHIAFDTSNNFIRPYSKDESKGKINIMKYSFPSIKEYCFNEVFKNKERTNLIEFLSSLTIFVFKETSYTFFTWSIIKLFISLYMHIKIRFQIVKKKYLGQLNNADKDSEFLSKMVAKVLEIIVFLITIFILMYQSMMLITIEEHIKLLIDGDCWPNANEFLNGYLNSVYDLAATNKILVYMSYVSAGIEVFTVVSYLFLYSIDLGLIKKRKIEEEQLEIEIENIREKRKKIN